MNIDRSRKLHRERNALRAVCVPTPHGVGYFLPPLTGRVRAGRSSENVALAGREPKSPKTKGEEGFFAALRMTAQIQNRTTNGKSRSLDSALATLRAGFALLAMTGLMVAYVC